MRGTPPTITIYATHRGNVFMMELASLLEATLRDLGREVTLSTVGLPDRREGNVNVVVAPHEFFHFAGLEGCSAGQIAEAAGASVCVTTEQRGTPWFEAQVSVIEPSPLVLDINRSSVEVLEMMGLSVAHLQLGYHRSIDAWGGDPERSRPVDVALLAAMNPRREQFLAGAAKVLWDASCDWRMFTFEEPITGKQDHFLVGQEKWAHLARSRTLLNVHRSETRYFEWLRVIEAMANGCVVVTEESVRYQPLVPFEHFVQAPLESLAEYALALLIDEAARAEMAQNAYDFLRGELDMKKTVGALLPKMDEAAQHKARRTGRRFSVPPYVEPVPPRDARGAKVDELVSVLDARSQQFRDAAKGLLMSQRSGLRHLEKVESAIHYGTDVKTTYFTTPSFEDARPNVSVVLTNFNYGRLIPDAIRSVVANTGVDPELIIIDDHSADDSLEVIRTQMGQYPWFPIKLVAKEVNEGLSAARNSGFALARSNYVFVLDADNLIYPSALRTLWRLLESRPGDAFAYGIIDCFSDVAPGKHLGLMSCLPWDPARLTRANYIDAMALVRRSAWEDVGGYDLSMDERFGGWEDFDLWLRFADQGYSASFAATPIGRYRVHGTSMLRSFNWAPQDALVELRQRYAALPWPA
jgi:GT2 family glycosyltransferase